MGVSFAFLVWFDWWVWWDSWVGSERGGGGMGRIVLVESFAYFLRVFSRYYEGGVSSVYFWDLDDGFAGVVLLKKSKSVANRFKGWEVDVDICSYADGEE